ncbi:hypothetical protein LINPERHAP1_LOCUS23298 [Linum perenne]
MKISTPLKSLMKISFHSAFDLELCVESNSQADSISQLE